MARKKKKRSMQGSEGSSFKYDLPNILLDFVYRFFPADEEMEGVDFDVEKLMSNIIFLCAIAWNISVLPKDCIDIFIAQMERVYKENDSHGAWDDLYEDILITAADMEETYPGGDCVITDHKLEYLLDGQMSLALDVVPLHEAVAAMRGSN